MKSLDCKLERVSNAMVGAVFIFMGLVFTILGITVIPVVGLLIALAAFAMGVIFLLSPRSRACTLLTQKVRGVAKSRLDNCVKLSGPNFTKMNQGKR